MGEAVCACDSFHLPDEDRLRSALVIDPRIVTGLHRLTGVMVIVVGLLDPLVAGTNLLIEETQEHGTDNVRLWHRTGTYGLGRGRWRRHSLELLR
jgi:hypothetical protein